MNMNQLAKEIALIEGKRKPISIAQVKEVLGILADYVWDDVTGGDVVRSLVDLGHRRVKTVKARRK